MTQNNLIMTLTFCLAVALIIQHSRIDALCNVCSNGIACVNQTSFNNCEGTVPDTSVVFTCPGMKQCSNSTDKCVDPVAGVTPTCDFNTRACGICDGTRLFSCTSRTTFLQCNGSATTNITGTCKPGLVCDSRNGELCKNECNRPQILECDIDAPL